MRDDGARFALVAFSSRPGQKRPTIITISEDALPAATSRGWMVLGRDSDVLTMFNPPHVERTDTWDS